MGLVEDIDAIYADNGLTPQQKHQNAAALKANGWLSAILGVGVLPQQWGFNSGGFSWVITIAAASVSGGTIRLDGVVMKEGVILHHNPDGSDLWPLFIQNPPLLYDDNTGSYTIGGRKLKFDLIALARSIMADVLTKAVA